ncbi:flagellar hook protein FlgE [Angustibacter sp. Root456]|uniref:flagellar hook protein FlgE n=1 Tax=Angustibacter sp. Root456 TaxID=1736539 RepID=UPI0006FA5976|nr:flagellar hook protein FlgE [Angustibacter sp. Root456]KQX69516.1 flagellar hook protein [Angustibacter sp. Root456]
MLRSLYSGISGLRANQTMMDVVGNNIANVNTAGFKTSNTVFQDTLSQLVQGASAPTGARGGTNPAQIGLGVRVAAITTNFNPGAAQSTGRSSDVMIQGDGFFVERSGNQQLFTRNGALSFDATGRLVGPDGGIIQGWMADAAGAINTNGPVGDLSIPLASTLAPQATTTVKLSGNLPADGAITSPQTSVDVYDAQGVATTLQASFNRTSNTTWDVSLSDGTTTSTSTLTFGASGATPTPANMTFNGVTVDLSQLTGYSGLSTLAVQSADGSAAGTLQGFAIGSDGVMTGTFSNGLTRPLGQLAVATVTNPAGLSKAGNSAYVASPNSGTVQFGAAGTGSRGALAGGALEMSNVDLAAEFTNLIVAQRGFQANSRIITAGDEILQDLVNIKR